MLPATFCAGMTLPLITYRLLRSPTGERVARAWSTRSTRWARSSAWSSRCTCCCEWLGLKGTLLVGAAIDVALGVVLLAATARRRGRGALRAARLAGVAALVALARGRFDIDPRKRSASGVFRTRHRRASARRQRVLYHRDGKTATVDVVEYRGRARDPHQRQVRRGHQHPAARRRRATSTRWRCWRCCRSATGPTRRAPPSSASAPGMSTADAARLAARSSASTRSRSSPRWSRARASSGRQVEARLQRPAQPHRHRRRQVVLRARAPALRHHRLGAVEPLGERRGDALHARSSTSACDAT